MYCPYCGAHNEEYNSAQCMNCGRALSQATHSVPPVKTSSEYSHLRPESHLTKAILATLFCCVPFGIVAIIFAAQVNSKFDSGDVAGARTASQQANTWGNVSIIFGLIGSVAYVALVAAGGM